MYDILFYTSNFLLCLMSTQLYQVGNEDDLFVAHTFSVADMQLRECLDYPDGDVCSAVPAKVVRALLTMAVESAAPPSGSIVANLLIAQATSGRHSAPSSSHANLHTGMVANISSRREDSLLARAIRSFLSTGFGVIWRFQLQALQNLFIVTNYAAGSSHQLSGYFAAVTRGSIASGIGTGDESASGPVTTVEYVENRDVGSVESSVAVLRYLGHAPVADRCVALLLLLLHNRRLVHFLIHRIPF